jgi:hypothetical protein
MVVDCGGFGGGRWWLKWMMEVVRVVEKEEVVVEKEKVVEGSGL